MSKSLEPITVDTYEAMAADGLLPERGVELIDGRVRDMSPKGYRHGYAVSILNEHFVDQRRGRYLVYADSLSLQLGPHDEPEPDIALARAGPNFARAGPRPDEIALIVEVADSSLAFDLGEKARKYAGAGIPEYWIVDLPADTFHLMREPRGDDYAEMRTARAGALVSPAEFPDVFVDVSRVLGVPAEP